MNRSMAAPAKNGEPMIALLRALTGKPGDSKLPISPGQSQQTVPAIAKAMAKTQHLITQDAGGRC
jgi:hypothetical protein